MDAQVKKRMTQNITLWQKTGTVDGDGTWADAQTLKGYSVPEYRVIKDRDGTRIETNTTIYLDMTDLIHKGDEVATDFIERTPVRAVIPYPALRGGYELIQVMI